MIEKNRSTAVELLLATKRPGMAGLICFMDRINYFHEPASSRFHGCYPGGLCQHSLNVLEEFIVLQQVLGIDVRRDTSVICGLLHDLCKAGIYTGNATMPKDHARASIARAEQHITLTDQEKRIIGYHMGIYSTLKWYDGLAANDIIVAFQDPAAKIFYFADEIATLKEKAREAKHGK